MVLPLQWLPRGVVNGLALRWPIRLEHPRVRTHDCRLLDHGHPAPAILLGGVVDRSSTSRAVSETGCSPRRRTLRGGSAGPSRTRGGSAPGNHRCVLGTGLEDRVARSTAAPTTRRTAGAPEGRNAGRGTFGVVRARARAGSVRGSDTTRLSRTGARVASGSRGRRRAVSSRVARLRTPDGQT